MKQRPFEILYEDEDILVINKKAGILSIPDRYNSDKENLFALLSSYRETIFPLHRLDRDTSGVMIYAKNEKIHKLLSNQWENLEIEKKYLAIVEGVPEEKQGNIKTFMAPSAYSKDKMVVSKRGKEAITSYLVRKSYFAFSVLEVKIKTGRQHQVRVHMAHIGHPLCVDKKYGNRKELFAYEIKTKKFHYKKFKDPIPLIKRHSLHALKLRFEHPGNGKVVEFEAPIPKDMRAVINQLEKWMS